MSNEVEEIEVAVKRRMPENLKRFLLKVKGGAMYLPAAYRLVWFRDECPEWGIATDIIEGGEEAGLCTVKAMILSPDNRVIATAHKTETRKGFADGHVEKAETGAVARALAMCGFGTQFSSELDDARPADSPVHAAHPPQHLLRAVTPAYNEPAPEPPPITRVQASEILTANDPPVSRCKDCGNTKAEGHKPECRHYKKAKPQEPAEPAAPPAEYQPSTKVGWELQNATFHAILHEAGIDSKDRPLVHHVAGLVLDVTPPPASMSDLSEHEYKTLNDKARQIGPEGLLLAAKGFDPFEAIPAAGRAA